MAQQTRNPTGDGTFSGTWSGSASSRYTLVDDHPDSSGADKLTHGTTAGRGTFTFSAFTVPAGSTITNVQVVYYDQKTASQGASWGAFLRVGGADRATNDAHNPANATWTLRTATYTTNPATSQAWTVDQVNGAAGSNNLEGFGVVATDASPTCEMASIQLVVNYTEPTTFQTSVTATAVGVPTVSRKATFARTVAATAVGTASLTERIVFRATAAATAVGVASVTERIVFRASAAATAVGQAAVAVRIVFRQSVAAIASGTATVGTVLTQAVGGSWKSLFRRRATSKGDPGVHKRWTLP
jgi:hypothetical protein